MTNHPLWPSLGETKFSAGIELIKGKKYIKNKEILVKLDYNWKYVPQKQKKDF